MVLPALTLDFMPNWAFGSLGKNWMLFAPFSVVIGLDVAVIVFGNGRTRKESMMPVLLL